MFSVRAGRHVVMGGLRDPQENAFANKQEALTLDSRPARVQGRLLHPECGEGRIELVGVQAPSS